MRYNKTPAADLVQGKKYYRYLVRLRATSRYMAGIQYDNKTPH